MGKYNSISDALDDVLAPLIENETIALESTKGTVADKIIAIISVIDPNFDPSDIPPSTLSSIADMIAILAEKAISAAQ